MDINYNHPPPPRAAEEACYRPSRVFTIDGQMLNVYCVSWLGPEAAFRLLYGPGADAAQAGAPSNGTAVELPNGVAAQDLRQQKVFDARRRRDHIVATRNKVLTGIVALTLICFLWTTALFGTRRSRSVLIFNIIEVAIGLWAYWATARMNFLHISLCLGAFAATVCIIWLFVIIESAVRQDISHFLLHGIIMFFVDTPLCIGFAYVVYFVFYKEYQLPWMQGVGVWEKCCVDGAPLKELAQSGRDAGGRGRDNVAGLQRLELHRRAYRDFCDSNERVAPAGINVNRVAPNGTGAATTVGSRDPMQRFQGDEVIFLGTSPVGGRASGGSAGASVSAAGGTVQVTLGGARSATAEEQPPQFRQMSLGEQAGSPTDAAKPASDAHVIAYADQNNLCPICLENVRDLAFVPCGHLICNTCGRKLLGRPGDPRPGDNFPVDVPQSLFASGNVKCCVCRAQVNQFVKVFL